MVAFDWSWITQPEVDQVIRSIVSEWREVPRWGLIKRLRKQFDSAQTAQLVEQAELRLRAAEKFSLAHQMWFTRRALEQATSEVIAGYKASGFEAGTRLADLCCGLGGDTIALAQNHIVAAIDHDPELVGVCQRNLAAYGRSRGEVTCRSALDVPWDAFEAIHIDPDRRRQGRTIQPSQMSPSLGEVMARVGRQTLCVKLAPATALPPAEAVRCHREWIGHQRECKQQLAWRNHPERTPGESTATVILNDGTMGQVCSRRAAIDAPPPGHRSSAKAYLLEPHAAVVAAGLVDVVAGQFGAGRVSAQSSLLATDHSVIHPLVATFQVLDTVPFRWDEVRATAQRLGLGTIEWKRHGPSVPWWDKAISWKAPGTAAATVIMTWQGQNRVAIFCRRQA